MFCLLRSVGPSPGSSCTQLLVGFTAARLSNSLLVYFTASLINLPFKSLKHLISIKDCFIFEGNISFSENSFLLFFPIYFYQLEANYFIILQWFLPYTDMNQPWIYMYSSSQSPLPPPSSLDHSGCSQCTSPLHLSHASNLGW